MMWRHATRAVVVGLALGAAGCSYEAPVPGRLREHGAVQYQAVAITREGDEVHVRSGVSSVAWGSMAAFLVLSLVLIAIPLVGSKKRDPAQRMDPWRVRAAAFFVLFTLLGTWWGASRLLVARDTTFSLRARAAHIDSRSLWGAERKDVVLDERAALFLVRVPSRSGNNYVLRLRVHGGEHTIAQAVGLQRDQPRHEALRDELAAMLGVGADRGVSAVYFAW